MKTETPRVLIAEDDPGCRGLAARVVRGLGLMAVTAAGEASAFALLRESDCALVLADLSMERADSGIRVAAEARRLAPGTPVILMTGHPGTETAIPGLREGASDYLVKPFRPQELADSIRRALARSRLSAELDGARATREELSAAYRQLSKVERQREAMLSIVSHELRTPLFSAEMAADLLGRPGVDAVKTKELLVKNLARLRETVEEFLLHAKLAGGGAPVDLRPGDLDALVRREAELAAPLAAERGILITVASEGPPAPAPLDEALAAQAVRHLLLNAVRFNRRGGRVEARVAHSPDAVRVTVRDDGPGIPAEKLQGLFDPFYQAADFLTREVGGLGLGLAIVRLAMDAHGGSAHAATPPEGGALFSLVFPRIHRPDGKYVAKQ